MALKKVTQLLAADGKRAVIFANFHIMSRQIDLFVATNYVALVIEAKGFVRPVRGGENGPWESRHASGQWKEFRNPYQQTLNAAYAIKNAVADYTGNGAPYIHAALVFSPEIPSGSQVFEGNEKVSLVGLDGLEQELRKRKSGTLSLDKWREFATRHLGLKKAPSLCAACDPKIAESENRLQQYKEKFCRTYTKENALVPFSCQLEGKAIPSAEVVMLASERGGGLLLQGPSGCGKSILAEATGNAFNDLGGIAIIVQGKEFDGSVRDVLEREATLLEAQSAIQLIDDARKLSRPILFIVDGYNECVEELQGRFTRGISALAVRYKAGVLITSQVALARSELLDLSRVYVPPPAKETKTAIAKAATGGKVRMEAIEHILDAVSTSLEAKLVGEVGANIPPGRSRYALFDAFARKRLGIVTSDGIWSLSQVATYLFERFAFSLSIREFDRYMDNIGVSDKLRRLLIDKGLLTLRGDRVSFPHEMFLDAFAAEAIVRQADSNPELVLKALSSPLHAARKDLVIGAIDDENMLECLLPRLEDDESVRACLQGRCGSYAQEWAKEYCRQLWVRIREEACRIRYRIRSEDLGNVEFESSSLTEWSRCDRAFFTVFPKQIAKGQHLENALDVIGIMDERIAEETLRLREQTGSRKTELQIDLFAISYVHPQRSSDAPGISTICSKITSGVFKISNELIGQQDETKETGFWQDIMSRKLSSGQLYIILELCRSQDILPASFIRRAINTRWDTAPYHLRLLLMDAVTFHHIEDSTERVKMIEVIDGLSGDPFLGSSILDALRSLGALDQDAEDHQAVVFNNIKDCLRWPEHNKCQAEAWNFYIAQFDHPYSIAYCEAVANLTDSERKTMLEMASRGAEATGFFLGPLLLELASFGDKDVGESIKRWTKPPPTDNRFTPQSYIVAFVVAHVALARLGCPLPNHQMQDEIPSQKALRACGALLYWNNREDLDDEVISSESRPELNILIQHCKGVALDVLRECEEVLTEGFTLLPGNRPVAHSIVGLYPDKAVEISRDALCNPLSQEGYFGGDSQFARNQILAFGIRVLEKYGNKSDCSLLRKYASSQEYGGRAIAALKAIEERVVGHH